MSAGKGKKMKKILTKDLVKELINKNNSIITNISGNPIINKPIKHTNYDYYVYIPRDDATEMSGQFTQAFVRETKDEKNKPCIYVTMLIESPAPIVILITSRPKSFACKSLSNPMQRCNSFKIKNGFTDDEINRNCFNFLNALIKN